MLREHLEDAGYPVEGTGTVGRRPPKLDSVRRGERLSGIQVAVGAEDGARGAGRHAANKKQDSPRKAVPMSANDNRSQVVNFFEVERTYPNEEAHEWYERLVGIDDHKKRLLVELEDAPLPRTARGVEP